MKTVVDATVVISAAIVDGTTREILASQSAVEWYATSDIVSLYREHGLR